MEPRAPTPEKRIAAIAGSARPASGGRDVRAGDPGRQRRRVEKILTRADAAGAREAGYVGCACRWRSGSCSASGCRSTPRQAQARVVAGAVDARRQGLRFAMGTAHGGIGTLRLDDRPPLRDRRRTARLSRDPGRAARRSLPAAGARRRARADAQLSLF